MTAPPGNARHSSEPRVEQISAEREPDLSTKTKQMRYLVAELGVSRPQAHALIRAFERDQERPLVTSGETYRASFIDWLMRQAPSPRKPTIRKWRIGETGWRTAS